MRRGTLAANTSQRGLAMRQVRKYVLGLALALPLLVSAQAVSEPKNAVQISAMATREVAQDWLTVSLYARQQGADAVTVQGQLKAVLDKALSRANGQARAGEVEVSTGGFSVQPRYGKDGQIQGWQGSAELLIQGRDVARLAALAGQLPGMAVASMTFSLSREAVQQLESELRREAIGNFRRSAQAVAQDFGYSSYELREVTVQLAGNEPPMYRQRMLAADSGVAMAMAPVPAEPGKSTVQVNVSGSVQLVK